MDWLYTEVIDDTCDYIFACFILIKVEEKNSRCQSTTGEGGCIMVLQNAETKEAHIVSEHGGKCATSGSTTNVKLKK